MTHANSTFTDDQRVVLAGAAARTQRANQPRHLLLFACVLLAGAVLALSLAWRASTQAKEQLATQRATAEEVAQSAGKLRALKQAAASGGGGPRANEPLQQIFSRIERASVDAGLKEPARLPRDQKREPNLTLKTVRVRLTYEVRDPDIGAIVAWTRKACEEVPGLEVSSLELSPEAQRWKALVVFTRWEREQGT